MGRRPFPLKVMLSAEERRAVAERARGYATPADYARRVLVAGWAPPIDRIASVTRAFVPIQEVIDKATSAGFGEEASAATDALRAILRAVAER